MNPGLLGGILGGVIGLLGGIFGTYFSIRNTKGPRERAFMIKCSVIIWILVSGFIGAMMILPSPYKFILWVPYGILLAWGIRKINNRQAELRRQEQ